MDEVYRQILRLQATCQTKDSVSVKRHNEDLWSIEHDHISIAGVETRALAAILKLYVDQYRTRQFGEP